MVEGQELNVAIKVIGIEAAIPIVMKSDIPVTCIGEVHAPCVAAAVNKKKEFRGMRCLGKPLLDSAYSVRGAPRWESSEKTATAHIHAVNPVCFPAFSKVRSLLLIGGALAFLQRRDIGIEKITAAAPPPRII